MSGATAGDGFIVMKSKDPVNGQYPGVWRMGSSGQNNHHPHGGDGRIWEDFGSNAGYQFARPAVSLSTYYLYNVSAKAGSWEARQNGRSFYSRATNTVGFRSDPTLGTASGSGQYGLQGDIAEVIVYDHVLTDAEREAVGKYIGNKYGFINEPTAPVTVTAVALSNTQVSVAWAGDPGNAVQYYEIERKAADETAFTLVNTVADSQGWVDLGVKAGTSYTYRVRTHNYSGTSAYSNEAGVTTPTTVTTGMPSVGLRLWLKADAGLAVGGVGQWSDQSGLNNHATQTDSASRPTLVTNVLNGRPVVRFGGDQFLRLPDLMSGATAGDGFIVMKSKDPVNGQYPGVWRMGSSGQNNHHPHGGDGRIWEDFGSNAGYQFARPAVSLSTYYLYNVSANAGAWEARQNGRSFYSRATNTVGFRSDPTLGTATSNGQYGLQGDIAEVIVYDHVLTEAERDAVGKYLSNKYAFVDAPTVPTNLTALALSNTQVSVAWQGLPGNGVQYYEVERKDSAGDYVFVATVADSQGWTDNTVTAGISYTYRVRARNYNSRSDYSNVATVTTPTTVTTGMPSVGLRLWLKADAGLAVGEVGQWSDQSGLSNHATQTDNASRPTLVTNVLNGRPVVRFGGNQFLRLPDLMSGATAGDGFIVMKSKDPVNGQYPGVWRMGSSGQNNHHPHGDDGRIWEDFGSNAGYQFARPAVSLSTYYLYNVSAKAGSWEARQNGRSFYSRATNTVGFRSDPTLGTASGSGQYGLQGDIAEVIVYDHVLTDAERERVQFYLFKKYNFGLENLSMLPVAGLYTTAVDVTIASAAVDSQIYYTTDGSSPASGVSALYTAPIHLAKSTLVRAQGYSDNTSTNEVSALYTIGNPPAAVTPLSGLSATYYQTADFGGSSTRRLDAQLNNPSFLTLPTGWQGNGVSARWTGELIAQFTETHTFTLTTNGGVRLWFGNDLVMDDWNGATSRTLTFARDLTAGTHYPIRVEFQRRSSDAPQLTLQWAGFSTIQQIMPQSQWISGLSLNGSTPALVQGLLGEYYTNMTRSGTPALRRNEAVAFNWGGGSPDSLIPADQFSVRWTGMVIPVLSGSYTFSTVSDDGVRLWLNDQLIIENWGDHGDTSNTSSVISLTAGTAYNIRLEYYENGGGATIHLQWTPPDQSGASDIPIQLLYGNNINSLFAATPTATPAAGLYGNSVSVALSTSVPVTGAQIYYTLDGSDPTNASALYTSPITLNQNTTLKAIAYASGLVESGILVAPYTLTTTPPALSTLTFNGATVPATLTTGGTFGLRATDATGIRNVQFLLDGNLLANDTVAADGFTAPFSINAVTDGAHTLTAQAWNNAGLPSAVFSAALTVTLPPPPAPTITAPADNTKVNQAAGTIRGIAVANTLVTLYQGTSSIGSTQAGADGSFAFNVTLATGLNTFSATATNRNPQPSPASSLVTVTYDNTVPAPPQAVTASGIAGGKVTVSWQAPLTGLASGYYVFRSDTPFTSSSVFNLSDALGGGMIHSLSFTDTPPANGRYYYMVLTAYSVGNGITLSAPAVPASIVSDSTPPSALVTVQTVSAPFDAANNRLGRGLAQVTVVVSKRLAATPFFSLTTTGSPIFVDLQAQGETTYTGVFTITANTPSGLLGAVMTAVDVSGNRGTQATFTTPVTIDTSGPQVTGLVPAHLNGDGTVAPLPVFDVIKNDPAVTVSWLFTLNEAPKAGTTPSFTAALSAHAGLSLPLIVTDAGDTDSRTWVVTLAMPSDAGATTETLALSFSALDDLGNTGSVITPPSAFQVYQGTLPPLSIPAGLSAQAQPAGAIALAWTPVTGASAFVLQVKAPAQTDFADLEITPSSASSYNYTPSTDGAYSYRIASVRTDNGQDSTSGWSPVATAVSDRTVPGAPTSLALGVVPQGVQATWLAPSGGVADVADYELYRSATAITTLSGLVPVLTGIAPAALTAVDVHPAGTNPYYALVAIDQAGNRSAPATAFANVSLLPVGTLSVAQSAGGPPALAWQAAPGSVIDGYHLFIASQPVTVNQTTLIPSSTSSYTDNAYTSGDRLYTIQTVSGPATVARSILLPAVSLSLVSGAQVQSGLMNTLQVRVQNASSAALSDAVLTLTLDNHTVAASAPITLAPSAETIASVVVGGYADLALGMAPITLTLKVHPQAGETVTLAQPASVPVIGGGLSAQILPGEFVRGGTGSVRIQLTNPSSQPIEFKVARQQGSQASDEVRLSLLDPQLGTVLSTTPVQILLGDDIVTLADGTTVVRVPAGGTYTSPAISLPVPLSAPSLVNVALQIDSVYFDYGHPDTQVTLAGPRSQVQASTRQTSYSAAVTSVSPASSNGSSPITILGLATWRPTDAVAAGTPAPGVSVVVSIANNGFIRQQTLLTDANGLFTYIFTPGETENGGIYQVWASHPDVITPPDNPSTFTITRVLVSPTTFNIRAPRNYTQALPVTISTGPGTSVANLRAVLVGTLPAAVNYTTQALPSIAPGQQVSLPLSIVGLAATPDALPTGTLIFNVVSDDGAGGVTQWATLTVNYTFTDALPVIQGTPTSTQIGVQPGQTASGTIMLQNQGFAALEGATLSLVSTDNTPVPAWIRLQTPAVLGTLDIGAASTVAIGVAAPSDTLLVDKVYSLYLRVSGPGVTTVDFPVTVTVSPSGQGGALLKLVDPYYQLTLPGDAPNAAFYGVSGASVVLDKDSSTGVPTATFSATSDANGEVSLSALPAGRYILRISAAKHDTYIQNITIQPGVIYAEQVPLVYAPVSFSWSVVPVTFQDTYNLTLTATFETNVPLPVVVIEPGAINLPKMCAGQVYNGEFTISNHGLIDATNVTLPVPASDDNFSYELLSSFGDKIKAGQTVTVAFRVKCLKPLEGACDQVTTAALQNTIASARGLVAQAFTGHGGSVPANAGCVSYSKQLTMGYEAHCANGIMYPGAASTWMYWSGGTCGGGTGNGPGTPTYNGGYGGYSGPGGGGPGGGGGSTTGGSTTGGSTATSDKCFPDPQPCPSPGVTTFEVKDCRKIKVVTDCNGRHESAASYVDLASRQYIDDAKDIFVSVPGGTVGVARAFEFGRWSIHVADPLYCMGVGGDPYSHQGDPLILNGRAFTSPKGPLWLPSGGGGASVRPGLMPLSNVLPGIYKLWDVGPEQIIKNTDGTYLWSDEYGNERAYDAGGLLVSRSHRGQLFARYLYDFSGRLTSIADRNGRTVMTFTTVAGQLLSVQDMTGRSVAYTYDSAGRLATVTSPLATVMTYTYDDDDHLIGKRTHLAGQTPDQDHQVTIAYEYIKGNKPIIPDYRVSPIGVAPARFIIAGQPSYGYYRDSYVTRVSHNTGESKSFIFKFNTSTHSYTTQVTDAAGRQEVSVFDANGVLTSQSVNGQQVYALQSDNNTRVITRGGNESTTEEFNEQGYLTRRVLPDGGIELYEYDPTLGLPTKETDPLGVVTTHIYDAQGNTLTTTEAVGTALQRVTTNTYKPGTNLLTLTTAPDGRQTAYVYDDQDRLITTYDPAQPARQTTYTYDDLDNVLTTTDALGHTTTYAYDAENHVISETNALGESTLSNYQGDQLVQREVGHTDTASGLITRYTYDAQGRRVQEKRVDAAGTESVFKTYAYDDAGHLLTETNALGQVTSYRYDPAGNPSALSVPADDGTRSEALTTYDALARPVETIDPVGNHTTTQYDLRDRPSLVIEAAGTPLARTTTYAYDLMGRVRTLALSSSLSALSSTTYTYDILGRRTAVGGNRPYATTTTYDSADRVLTQTDALGRVTSYDYDSAGQLSAVRLNGTVIEAYTYDLVGNRLSVTDGVGNHRHTHYDALNRADAESIALSSGQSAPEQWWTQPAYVLQATAYTPFGQVASVTRYNTVNGTVTAATTTRAYDAFGRPFTETDPAGLTVTTTYDLADNVLQIAYPAVASSGATTGSTVTYLRSIYNAALVDGVIDRAGNTTYMAYDAAFRVVSQTNSLGGVTQRAYDALGRVTTETLSPIASGLSPQTTTATYDAFDQPLAITYPDNVAGTHERIETFSYDSHGKLLQKGGAGGYPLVYTYDAVGNLLTLQDANAHVTTWTYTARNQVATKTYADATGYTYTYDDAGRLLTRQDALNRTTTYAYNAYGQPTDITYPTDPAIACTYDTRGRRLSMTDGSGTTTWTYDELGRPASETQGRSGRTLAFGYDAYSQRTSLDVSVADSQLSTLNSQPSPPWHTGYGYDNAGRLRTVLDARLPAGQPYTYTYATNAGLVAQITTPTGLQLKKTYDNQGRLVSTSALNSQLSTLNSASYTYDIAGQRNTETTPDHARTFTYDAQRQLTDATGTVGASDTEQFSFAFDGIGNRLSSSASSPSPIALGPVTYTANAVNQYTALTGALADTPTYDLNGNTTGLNGQLLVYDEENRLKQVSDATRTITYIYDGLGRRVERIDSVAGGATTGVRYVYDGWRVIEETDQAGTVLHSYTRGLDLSGTPEGAGGIGGLLAMATPSGGTWAAASYAYDGNGNVTDLINDNGTSAAHYTYGPFGERLTATGALADINAVQFSSKERDAFTGFYYYGLRYYNPGSGRWLNRDPIQEQGGVNLYGMVENNPINTVDLFGLLSDNCEPCKKLRAALDAAQNAAATYGDSDPAPGWKIVDPKTLGIDPRIMSDDASGFSSTIFKNDATGAIQVGMRGTDPKTNDIATDIFQGAGFTTDQYRSAVIVADAVRESVYGNFGFSANPVLESGVPRLSFTGHSLGGGLAARATMRTHYDSVGYTFNAAGVNPLQSFLSTGTIFAGSTPANIDAYYINGEFLHRLQYVSPAADGTRISLDGEGNMFKRHRISMVIEALKNLIESKCN